MLLRRRCPFCRRWYHPHPRLKQRQKTCGRPECRRQQKQKSNQQWRAKNPDYFRDTYAHQKEKYGTRADYMRLYRQQHPDYVRRNAAFVRKWRVQQLKPYRAKRLRPVSRKSHKPRYRRNPFAYKGLRASIYVSHTRSDCFSRSSAPFWSWRGGKCRTPRLQPPRS